MKTFRQYIEENDEDLGISGASTEDSLLRLARIAIKNHQEELLDFFRSLAGKDTMIRDELNNIDRNLVNRPLRQKGKPALSAQDDRQHDVVPAQADNAGGIEGPTW